MDYTDLSGKINEESSESIKERVNKARAIQTKRYENSITKCNARLTDKEFEEYCKITDEANELLKNAFEKMGLSARGYNRILKVARTIADLDNSDTIDVIHVAEAVQYRSLDRKYWRKN